MCELFKLLLVCDGLLEACYRDNLLGLWFQLTWVRNRFSTGLRGCHSFADCPQLLLVGMWIAYKVKLKNAFGLFAANVPKATLFALQWWFPLRLLVKLDTVEASLDLERAVWVILRLRYKSMGDVEQLL